MSKAIEATMAAIDSIERRLPEKLDLETLAGTVHYSRYHLHRMFSHTVGLTPQTYIRRRRLTEAARLLAFSREPILMVALSAGYESQQAFSDAFKAMYKKTPGQVRMEKSFYPLQLPYVLKPNPTAFEKESGWERRIAYAESADIPVWMKLVPLVIDGFPCLNEKDCLEKLRESIANKRALILKDGDTAAGVMAFHERAGSIDFLAVHPQYRGRGIARALCQRLLERPLCPSVISVTTFRQGDKADTGYRRALKALGFAEAEPLVEFGYPTQRFLLEKARAHE